MCMCVCVCVCVWVLDGAFKSVYTLLISKTYLVIETIFEQTAKLIIQTLFLVFFGLIFLEQVFIKMRNSLYLKFIEKEKREEKRRRERERERERERKSERARERERERCDERGYSMIEFIELRWKVTSEGQLLFLVYIILNELKRISIELVASEPPVNLDTDVAEYGVVFRTLSSLVITEYSTN